VARSRSEAPPPGSSAAEAGATTDLAGTIAGAASEPRKTAVAGHAMHGARRVTIPVVPAAAAVAAGGTDVGVYLRPGTLRLPVLPPLSLYVHFPWCVRKCPYCDFNSHEPAGGALGFDEPAYLAALRADLESALPLIWGRQVLSVFVGGGTPSLMSAAGVERLLSDVRALLPLQADAEITLEANPGTFEAARFAAYRTAGVNRLSIGVQSFDPRQLLQLGRVHDRAQAVAAIELAARCFDNYNLDLMYALPEQTPRQARADVATALGFGPPHLSLYQLTIEANTVFAKHPPRLPDDDTAATIHEDVEAALAAAGYRHYEVSAYARGAQACRHNLNYWQFGDYLGIGAGAASKLSFPHRIVRQSRWRQPDVYLRHARDGAFVAEAVEVDRSELPFEFMLNALRLNDGFAAGLFAERTGLPLNAAEKALARAESLGLLTRTVDRITPTLLGRRFLTDLQSLFLPEKRRGRSTA
jgi:oxygen-independent coproporphyrinogen-3 oxidase